jgi:hypothetical protein
MSPETMIVLSEALLIFGGAIAFGLWQLRSIKKDQKKATAAKNKVSRD